MTNRERLISSIKQSFSGRLSVAASEVLAPVVADRLIADGVIPADNPTEKGGAE